MAELSERDVLVFLSAGVFGTVLGRLFLFTGVELVGASIYTAGLNSRPLFVLVLGVVFLGEYVTPLQVFGILIIVVGVVVLSLSKGGDIRGWDRRQLIFPATCRCFARSGERHSSLRSLHVTGIPT
jgi:drug/metabolite transporter (DMT)-like permease